MDEKDTMYWYRVEGQSYAPPADEYGDPQPGPGSQEIKLYKVQVLKVTPKGRWLATPDGKRFQLDSANRKYACSSIELALQSFIKKKERQRSIYLARAETANRFAGMAWLQLKNLATKPLEVSWVIDGPSGDK